MQFNTLFKLLHTPGGINKQKKIIHVHNWDRKNECDEKRKKAQKSDGDRQICTGDMIIKTL